MTYTVPQHIRPAMVDKAADVFFRVNRVCGASEIRVCCGDRLLVSYKRDHLAPGEMEHILLPRKLLDAADGPLTISIAEPVGGAQQ